MKPMSRNKIPHSMKGIIKVAIFFTLKCERGKMHEDKVKFDQVNNATMREWITLKDNAV